MQCACANAGKAELQKFPLANLLGAWTTASGPDLTLNQPPGYGPKTGPQGR